MMAAPQMPFDVMRATVALSAAERAALNVCQRFADEGKRITQYDICEAIGSENWNGGTAAGILNRLEAKGYITRVSYRRTMQICIAATGKCTVPEGKQVLHGKERSNALGQSNVPTPAIQAVRQQAPNEAKEIERDASERGLSYHQHMMDLVLIGHRVLREGPQ